MATDRLALPQPAEPSARIRPSARQPIVQIWTLATVIGSLEPTVGLGVFEGLARGWLMLDGFTKRDFAIFAAALCVAGALTVGAVDFVIYHYVFQDTNAAPILAK